MPRNYVRKTKRQTWDTESMNGAVLAVRNGEMGWSRASKLFKIPQATLRRHALSSNKTINIGEKRLGRFKPTIPVAIEKELVSLIKLLETRLFELTRNEVQALAYQLAVKNNYENMFNHDKKKMLVKIG